MIIINSYMLENLTQFYYISLELYFSFILEVDIYILLCNITKNYLLLLFLLFKKKSHHFE